LSRYEPLPHLVLWLTFLFVAGAIFDALGAGMGVLEVLAFPGIGARENIEDPFEIVFVLSQGLSALGSLLAFVATAVLFLVWLKKSGENALALGARGMDYTPGWRVGWYFVPVYNLVKPFKAMSELWKASDPGAGPEDWKDTPTPGLLRAWWGIWVGSNLLNQAATRLELKGLAAAPWVSALGDLAGVAACTLALLVVRGLHARQEAKAARSPAED